MKTKKRIAIIHGSLVFGGAEKALINMLHYLDYSKYDVTLWLEDTLGEMQDQVDRRVHILEWGSLLNSDYKKLLQKKLSQARIYRCFRSIVCRALSKVNVNDWRKNLGFYYRSIFELEDSHEEYDVAMVYQGFRREQLVFMSNYIKANKKFSWIHGECHHDKHNPYFKPFPKEYKKLDHIFCVSESVQKLFLKKYPQLFPKCSVMYNLQNIEQIRSLAMERVLEAFDGITLLTVGRLSKEKGQEMIPKAARNLLDRGLHFTWYVIGDGKERNTIEQGIRDFGVGNVVVLLGARQNPYPYINKCTLYVQTSYTEGFCVVTFEAKILNTPVVTTDVPGMREQFREGEAVFCEPEPESIARAVLEGLNRLPDLAAIKNEITDEFNYTELAKLYREIGD